MAEGIMPTPYKTITPDKMPYSYAQLITNPTLKAL